jgi:hypothetical protein
MFLAIKTNEKQAGKRRVQDVFLKLVVDSSNQSKRAGFENWKI